MPNRRKRANTQTSLINLKVTPGDRRRLNAAAKRWTRGNLSMWIRFAGTHFKPKKVYIVA